MVGHSNLGLADAIRRRCETGDLTLIGIRHEEAASFAASAFAKLTGRIRCFRIRPNRTVDSIGYQPPEVSVAKALDLVRKARRPVIIVGHGSRHCMTSIIQFAEQLNAPVITTLKGKGLVSHDHPLACGVLGLSGVMA